VDVPEYDLPEAAIAQEPSEPRDAARLLVAIDPFGAVEHRHVRDLPELLQPGDGLVVNTSRVLAARLRRYSCSNRRMAGRPGRRWSGPGDACRRARC